MLEEYCYLSVSITAEETKLIIDLIAQELLVRMSSDTPRRLGGLSVHPRGVHRTGTVPARLAY